MRRAKIAVQRHRPLQFADASLSAVGVNEHKAQPEMGPKVARRDRDSLDQKRFGLRERAGAVVVSVDRADHDAGARRANERIDISGVESHGALEKVAGAFDVLDPSFAENCRPRK